MKHEEIKSSCSVLTATWQIKKSNPPIFEVKWRKRKGGKNASWQALSFPFKGVCTLT